MIYLEEMGTGSLENGKTSAGPNPGLCRDCQHMRKIKSDRGSIFIQCQLSFEDSQFAKYPRLPVLSCSGYCRAQKAD